MKVIRADHERRYEIPGASEPARRPVDIDTSKTGFKRLRSLRIYRFNAGSVIDGHAEEDEVFVVVTSGSIEIKIGFEDSTIDAVGVFTLVAPTPAGGELFVAYLPPRSVYQLTPHKSSDVAYARATPLAVRPPSVFAAEPSVAGKEITTLLEERSHAERLQLKVVRVEAREGDVTLAMLEGMDTDGEALVHVQGSPAQNVGSLSSLGGVPLSLASWDTAALDPGERPELHVLQGSTVSVLTVLALCSGDRSAQ